MVRKKKLSIGIDSFEKVITENFYTETLIDDGMKTILKYGIACYKKCCRVALKETL